MDQDEKQKALADAAEMSARIMVLANAEPETEESRPNPESERPVGVRKPNRLVRALLGLLGIALFAAGCWTGAKVARRHDDSMVVTVNGELIKANEFLHHCEISAGSGVLQQMINGKLQLQFAKQKGVFPTPAAIEARYMEYAKQKDFLVKLRLANETPEEFKQELLIRMAREAVMDKGVNVTAAEVEQYYKENCDPRNPQARYYHPETVTIAVIINDSEDAIRKAQKDLANGMSFADAVPKYSKDVSRSRSGILNPIRRGMVDSVKLPGLEQKLFDLSVGKNTDPFQIKDPRNGKANWWIIRCLAKTPEATTDPFDKVADECRNNLALLKGMKANGDVLQEEEKAFGHNADITFGWTQYAALIRRR